MKILAKRWIGGRTTIGVVCIENSIGKRSVRIATVEGHDEEEDAEHVSEWGTKLSYSEAAGFFPDLINKKTFKYN